MAVIYCTADNVAGFLQRKVFDATTKPTKVEVEKIIERKQDFIDTETGHAWREKIITEEYIDRPTWNPGLGQGFYLSHRSVKTFAAISDDKIEIWNGQDFIDYVTDKTEGRGGDYFVDETNGAVYIKDVGGFALKGNRFSYRYGEDSVAGDIEDACIKLVAIDILTMNDKAMSFSDDGPSNRLTHDRRTEKWQEAVDEILGNNKEFRVS